MSKLECLSCPFTWKVWDDLASGLKLLEYNDKRFRVVDDIQDHFPEFVFIWNLMLAYESTMSDKLKDALHYIDEAQKTLADLKQKKILKNVENVLDRIFFATKYHVLRKLERSAEIDELLDQIHQHDDMEEDEVQSAMLYGCKCLAWSLYVTPRAKEKEFAKKAVECEPTNGKWHYLLGKSYRDNRRKYMSLADKPSEKESRAFKQAYELSKNDLFGLYWAQSLRDSRRNAEAAELYKDIYAHQPTSCEVRLKLALGFIREKECELAERCLNYVVEVMPSSPVLAHYMGIYEENCKKDLKAALPYYQTAIDNLRYPAALHYLKCKKRLEPDWDPLPYLLEVLKNCEQNSNIIAQEVNVAIATYYLYEKEDILSACRYLTEVIKIRPKPAILRQYHRVPFGPGESIKICDTLKEKFKSR